MAGPFRRIIWIVLDSVGIGAMPDAADYGDEGSNTLGHIASQRKLSLPNLCRLGLANIAPLSHLQPAPHPAGDYGKCALLSPGKDTTTGHWEMAGIILPEPLPLYPNGFPPRIIQAFEQRIGRKTLGNKAASGTEIIAELGLEHVRSGRPIVYTSADSVFQIAAHEQVIPLDDLYRMCSVAREILVPPDEVGRVIARPFNGKDGHYTRTANRRDFAIPPPEGMLLDQLAARKIPVYGVGKIPDIFLHRGFGQYSKTINNADGMSKTEHAMHVQHDGLIWTNLVDFDQLYGHRNDVDGYAAALEAFDAWLSNLFSAQQDGHSQDGNSGDLFIINADHGCDPTTASTDHSREYTPLLVFSPSFHGGVNLGTRASLADIGQTVAENFGTTISAGTSFLHDISKGSFSHTFV